MELAPEKKAIQEDELQAIIAIFDRVTDLREKDVWKVEITCYIRLVIKTLIIIFINFITVL